MTSISLPDTALVLGFADRRDRQGRYPVTERSGSVAATIVKQWARNNRFDDVASAAAVAQHDQPAR